MSKQQRTRWLNLLEKMHDQSVCMQESSACDFYTWRRERPVKVSKPTTEKKLSIPSVWTPDKKDPVDLKAENFSLGNKKNGTITRKNKVKKQQG